MCLHGLLHTGISHKDSTFKSIIQTDLGSPYSEHVDALVQTFACRCMSVLVREQLFNEAAKVGSKPGDTLASIKHAYKLRVKDICEWMLNPEETLSANTKKAFAEALDSHHRVTRNIGRPPHVRVKPLPNELPNFDAVRRTVDIVVEKHKKKFKEAKLLDPASYVFQIV